MASVFKQLPKPRSLPLAGSWRRRPGPAVIERRLLLLSLDWTRAKDPRVPLGHASLLAALRQAAIPVCGYSFPVNASDFSLARIIDLVEREARSASPAVLDLGVGAYIWNEHLVQELLPALRRHGFAGRIILGGPQISYQGQGLERLYPHADVFVRGYGEHALVAVMQAEDPGTGGE